MAPRPARTEFMRPSRAASLSAAARHHLSVYPVGGNAKVRDRLNAFSTTMTSGT